VGRRYRFVYGSFVREECSDYGAQRKLGARPRARRSFVFCRRPSSSSLEIAI